MIPDEFKWFSFNEGSAWVEFWLKEPLLGPYSWHHEEVSYICTSVAKTLATKIIELGDESWDESLQQRPE